MHFISDLRNTIFFFLRRFKCYVWRGFSKRNGFPPLERLLLDFNPTRSHATFNLLATPSHKTIRLSLISPILLDTDPVIEDVVESVRCRLSYGGSTPSSEREDVGNGPVFEFRLEECQVLRSARVSLWPQVQTSPHHP